MDDLKIIEAEGLKVGDEFTMDVEPRMSFARRVLVLLGLAKPPAKVRTKFRVSDVQTSIECAKTGARIIG